MRKFFVFIICILLLSGCVVIKNISNNEDVRGSGELETQTFDFDDFDEVAISNTFKGEIRQGDEFFIEITMDKVHNILES
ncbi:MAG: hypothetical protein ACLFMO_05265 [Eubacteriales bacterium]